MNPLDSQGTIIQDALIEGDSGVVAKAEDIKHWFAAFARETVSVIDNNGQAISTGPIIDPARIVAPPAVGAPGRIMAGIIDPSCIVVPGNHDRWQSSGFFDRPDQLAERHDALVAAITTAIDRYTEDRNLRIWNAGLDTAAVGVIHHYGVGSSGKTCQSVSVQPKAFASPKLFLNKIRPYLGIDSAALRPMLGPIQVPAGLPTVDLEPWHDVEPTLVAYPKTPESVARMEAQARSLWHYFAVSALAELLERRKNKKTLARVVWRWLKKMVPVRGVNLRNRVSARKRQQREDYREQYIIIRPLTGIRVRITQQAVICLPGMPNVGIVPVKRGEHDDYVFVRLGSSRRDLGRVAHARRAVAAGRRSVADGHRARPGRRGGLRGAAAPVRSVGRAHSRAGAA